MKRLEELSQNKRRALVGWTVVVWLVVLLQLYLHGANIGDKPFWRDEASTWRVASQPLGELFTLPSAFHSQPPLYYLILHFLVGVNASEWFLRGFSWLCVAGLLLFVLLALDELSLFARVGFAVLFLFSPVAHFLSQEMRPYAMAALLVTLQQVIFMRLLREPSRRRAIHYVILTTLSLYTMSFDLWAFVLNGLVAAGLFVAGGLKRYRALFLAIAASGLLYVPYAVLIWHYQAHSGSGTPTWSGALAEAVKWDHFVQILGWFIPFGPRWAMVGYGLMASGAVAAVGARRAEILVLPAVVLFHIACIHGFLFERSFMADRYFTMVFPLSVLLCAFGIDALVRTADRRAFFAIIAVLAVWAWQKRGPFNAYLDSPLPLSGWRGVARALRAMPSPKVVMFDVGYDGQMLEYETRRDTDVHFHLRPGRGWAWAGAGNMTPEYVSETIEETSAGTRCYFYVATLPASPFHSVFVPELTRLGYKPTEIPVENVENMVAYCR